MAYNSVAKVPAASTLRGRAELTTIPHLPALYQRVKYRSTREGGGDSVAMTTSGGASVASGQRSSSIPLVQDRTSEEW